MCVCSTTRGHRGLLSGLQTQQAVQDSFKLEGVLLKQTTVAALEKEMPSPRLLHMTSDCSDVLHNSEKQLPVKALMFQVM